MCEAEKLTLHIPHFTSHKHVAIPILPLTSYPLPLCPFPERRTPSTENTSKNTQNRPLFALSRPNVQIRVHDVLKTRSTLRFNSRREYLYGFSADYFHYVNTLGGFFVLICYFKSSNERTVTLMSATRKQVAKIPKIGTKNAAAISAPIHAPKRSKP